MDVDRVIEGRAARHTLYAWWHRNRHGDRQWDGGVGYEFWDQRTESDQPRTPRTLAEHLVHWLVWNGRNSPTVVVDLSARRWGLGVTVDTTTGYGPPVRVVLVLGPAKITLTP